MAALLILFWVWHRLRRETAGSGPAKRERWRTGGLIALGIALTGTGLWAWATLMEALLHPDSWGLMVYAFVGASFAYGVLVGRVVVGRRALLSWPRLSGGLRDLGLGLAGCIALFPALLFALVVASALGHMPVTLTLWHGLVALSAGASLLASAGVWYRWRAAQADTPSTPASGAVATVTTGMAAVALTLFSVTYVTFDLLLGT